MSAVAAKAAQKEVKVDPVIDAKAIEKLTTARIGLLLRAPFFGNMATRLKLKNADGWLTTIATDGRYFYYNSNFVAGIPIKQLEFGFGHEVLHNCYDHMGRCGERDHQIHNIACDYVVNQDLIDQRIGERITYVNILHDNKYKGWSSEEVYDDLMKNAEKIDIKALAGRLADMHLDPDQEGPEPTTEEERKQIRDEIRDAMFSAAQAVGAGNLPAGVARMMKDLTEPKMNWRELIQQQILSTIRSDYTFMRPSRRAHHMDCILPGMNPEEMIDICVSVDLSGSISSKQCKDFFSEIYGIMQMHSAFRVNVWTFDTAVYNPKSFTQDNMDELLNYEPQGGGGTAFEANWEYMKEHGIEAKKFVMFTDGYPGGSWGDPDYCDTLFIIHGNDKIVPPFGSYAYYTEK